VSDALLLPATAEQRKMYTHHLLYPGDTSLNGPFVYEITGAVDAERLRAAAERVVRASNGLNGTFESTSDGIVGRDNRDRGYRVELAPLPGGDRATHEWLVLSEVHRLAETPMVPERWPLFQLRLWQGADRVYLAIVFSHIVCDASSLWVLFDLIRLAYLDPAGFAKREPELAHVPGTLLEPDPDPAEAVDFFRSRLSSLAALDSGRFPMDRAAGGAMPGRMAVERCSPALSARVRAALVEHELPPFPFFLGAYLVLLSGLTGSSRVTTGVPLANRRGRLQRRAIGYFVNTLPLSVDLDDYGTFDALCRDLQRMVLRMVRFQDFDLTAHAREVFDGRPPALLSVDNVFTFYKQPLGFQLPDSTVRRLTVPRVVVKYPLSLTVENDGDDLTLIADIAPGTEPMRPVECYRHLLDQLSRDPGTRLDRMGLLDDVAAAEVDALVNTGRPVPAPASLDGWLDEVAARQPDRIAVEDDSTKITYGELAHRVDHVARWIASEVEGGYVAVTGSRCVDLVVAMLGVVKAGKAYVPVDPDAPPARVERIASQFDALPLLIAGDVALDLPGARRIAVADVLAAPRRPAAPPGGTSDGAVYVIFTSGSTGAPKGVEVTHHGLARLFRSTADIFRFTPADTWCLFHSHAFDFSVWEMFGALLNGSRLVVVPSHVARSPADFLELLCSRQVTVLNQTPSAFGRLLDTIGESHRDRLAVRLLFVGAEAVRFPALRPWFELRGDACRVFDIYGPTEASVWVTWFEITPDKATTERDSVIGRPLPDVNVYLVDRHGHQVPVGAPGELLIGGAAPSKGYMAQPETTAAKYVHFGRTGERVYRTDDQCVLRPDGTLAFLGRQDSQIKLNGYRIELGEVEHALSTAPGVRNGIARIVDPDGEHARLVAYLVLDRASSEETLRAHLTRHLPPYMMPSVLVRLSELPLTVNGKVDDRALPVPPVAAAAAPAAPAGGAASLEQRIQAIWQEVMARADIGLDDNFFEAGGTSLHVPQIHARLKAAFDLPELGMADLFRHTTVRSLAGFLREQRPGLEAAEASPAPEPGAAPDRAAGAAPDRAAGAAPARRAVRTRHVGAAARARRQGR